jgi:hypothetical protein
MKRIIALFIILGTVSTYAQDEFQLKQNDEKKIEYQGVIENAAILKADLFTKGLAWCQQTDRNQIISFNDAEVGRLIAEAEFSTIGKKNAYTTKSYNYKFTCDVNLDFKDGKVRYTLNNFKKKTSPEEPGSSIEYFIENYKPKVSSRKARAREAKMLDQIELAVQDQIWDLIDALKKALGAATETETKTDEW